MAKRPKVAVEDFTMANLASQEDARPSIRPPDSYLENSGVRVVNERGDQMYRGPRPTKKLYRGGERVT